MFHLKKFLIAVGVVMVAMSPLLVPFFSFSLENTLYSHVILIPFVSAYFVYLRRETLVANEGGRPWLAVLPLLGAGAALYYRLTGAPASQENAMAAVALALVCCLWAAALLTLGASNLKRLLFPLLFLLFIVPFPTQVEAAIETFLQHGSAECAYGMFGLTDTTLFREGLVFNLPGISLQVAPECSGIRSSLVLFITSIVGGQLFLRSNMSRIALALFVIPLALVRNGFRVFVLGELCVHIGPHMIDSPIHHQGGPIFFLLSLIPFFGFVWLLMRWERRKVPPAGAAVNPRQVDPKGA
ncbi:MAG: exosortase [Opitutaceae bacterium]|nr:exosortase [Opitutaceae bacterium]